MQNNIKFLPKLRKQKRTDEIHDLIPRNFPILSFGKILTTSFCHVKGNRILTTNNYYCHYDLFTSYIVRSINDTTCYLFTFLIYTILILDICSEVAQNLLSLYHSTY